MFEFWHVIYEAIGLGAIALVLVAVHSYMKYRDGSSGKKMSETAGKTLGL